jgi:Helix-turn-helix
MTSNRSNADLLREAEATVQLARLKLAEAYQHRTDAAGSALAAGMTKTEVAAVLGVTRPAVNKILAGQDGMPARLGMGGEDAWCRKQHRVTAVTPPRNGGESS